MLLLKPRSREKMGHALVGESPWRGENDEAKGETVSTSPPRNVSGLCVDPVTSHFLLNIGSVWLNRVWSVCVFFFPKKILPLYTWMSLALRLSSFSFLRLHEDVYPVKLEVRGMRRLFRSVFVCVPICLVRLTQLLRCVFLVPFPSVWLVCSCIVVPLSGSQRGKIHSTVSSWCDSDLHSQSLVTAWRAARILLFNHHSFIIYTTR